MIARETRSRESKTVEFKEKFDPGSDHEWIELIKDFAAIANSGGGVIVIGARNDGSPSGADVEPVLHLDGATIADKLIRYVGEHFDEFEVHHVCRDGATLAAVVIGSPSDSPLVFVRPGTYPISERKQKTVFAQGCIYFRHGAKSEPATNADLRGFIARRLDVIRKAWLGGIHRVVTAPQGSEIVAIERRSDEQGEPTRIRITTDEDAPIYGRIDPDDTHPYRQTELIPIVNERLPRDAWINSHDVQSIRRVFAIDAETKPAFAHQGRYDLAPQYSENFADWIVSKFGKDPEFFAKTRERYRRFLHDER